MGFTIRTINDLVLGVVVSSAWLCIAILARMNEAMFFPQAIRFFGAGFVYLVGILLVQRRLPEISPRLAQAALTTGGLAYFLSPVFLFAALRVLPSGMYGPLHAGLPLFVILFLFSGGSSRLPFIAILFGALSLIFIGSMGQAALRGPILVPAVLFLVSAACFLASLLLFKRVFWIHSSLDLNYWSMLFASLAHLAFGLMRGELGMVRAWPASYWLIAAYLGLVASGLGVFLYARAAFRNGLTGAAILTGALAAGPMVLGFLCWGETPLNGLTVLGTVVSFAVLVAVALTYRANRWMSHFPHSGVRVGERLLCLMDGVLRFQNGLEVKIQIVDLSIGGLGFRAERECPLHQEALMLMPVSFNWSQIQVQCRVVRLEKSSSVEFPYAGGLNFERVNLERRQTLIEFLAKLSVTEDA